MADVDLSVAVSSTGTRAAIADLEALIKGGKTGSATLDDLTKKSVSLSTSMATAGSAMRAAGGNITGLSDAVTAQNQALRGMEASYKATAATMVGATAEQRLSAGATEKQIQAYLALKAAMSATLSGDIETRERARAAVRREATAATEQLVRAERELATARNGRGAAQQDLSRASQDSANQARGIGAVEQAQLRLTRAQEDLIRSTSQLASARGRLNGAGGTDAGRQEAYNAALRSQAGALRSVTAASEGLVRANQEIATSATSATNAMGDGNLSSFSYLIIAGGAQKLADTLYDVAAGAISASATIERSFADVERTFEGTDSQLAALQQTIIDLSLEDPISTIDIANIATLGNQLGVAAEDVEAFTQTIAEYSAVSGESADASATAFGKIGNLTGLAASQYSNLGSAIEYVARTTVSTEASISRTSQEISALADGAGFSASGIVGLAGALSSLSIPPERARGALSLYFGALNKAVAAGGPKLQAFAEVTGMSAEKITELTEASKGQEVFTAFISGLSELDNVAKTTALGQLGLSTIRVDQTMRALAGNVPLLTSSLDGSATAFQQNVELGKQYKIIQETLTSAWVEFQSAVQNGAAGIGDAFNTEALIGFLDLLTNLVAGFREFSQTPIGTGVLQLAGVLAGITFVAASLIGGLALLAAAMKVVPWALTGLGAREANNGLIQFVAGLLGVNLSVAETAEGQVVLATSFGVTRQAALVNGTALAQLAGVQEAVALSGSAMAAVTFEEAQALLLAGGAAEATSVGNGALAASNTAVAVTSTAASLGLKAMKFALISTGVGAAVVLVGSIIAMLAEFADTAQTASQAADTFFDGQDVGNALTEAFKTDQATFLETGDAITTIDTKFKATSTTARDYVGALESISGASVALNDATTKTTESVKRQAEAYGQATQDALASILVNNKGIQSLFEATSENAAAAGAGFDNESFLRSIVGDPEKGGQQYLDSFVQGLAAQTGTSSDEIKNIFDKINNQGFEAADFNTQRRGGANPQYEIAKQIIGMAGAYDTATKAVGSTSTAIQSAANDAAAQGAAFTAIKAAVSATEESFDGAASSAITFQDNIQAGLGKFGDFSNQLKALTDANKAANKDNPAPVTGKDFSDSLAGTNAAMADFYKDVARLAKDGQTSFATQIAAVGPDAAGVLADSIKMTPEAKAELEENARLAAFFVSDEFKTALAASMTQSNAAYAKIFAAPIKEGGGLAGVKEYIAAQVAGTGEEWEKEWDINHPDLTLNVDLGSPDAAQIEQWKQIAEGQLTVEAKVVPSGDPVQPKADVKTYTDTKSGKSITLPATLDGKALSASLEKWEQNEDATPTEIAAMLNTASFNGDVNAWVAAHGPIKVYAQLVPTGVQNIVTRAPKGSNVVDPSNARGGLLDQYGQGMPHYAGGGGFGLFSGGGSGTSDSLLARVSSGEYINTAASTNFWGPSFFDSLNKKMLPTSFVNMLGAAAVSGNQGPSHVANVTVVQNNPLTRDPLKQLREDSEKIAGGIW